MKFRDWHLPLILLFIIMLVLTIRFYPLVNFSFAPAVFSSYITFSDIHTMATGHLVENGDIEVYDQFSGQLDAGSQLHPILVLRPMISILTGVSLSSPFYHLILSIAICIPFLLACMSLLRSSKTELEISDYLICGLYSLIPTSEALSSLSYGGANIGYLVFIFYVLLYLKEETPSIKLTKIILVGVLAISYFTGAMAFLVITSSIVIFSYFSKLKSAESFNFVSLYAIILIAYIMYISTSRFGSLVHIGTTIYSLFSQDSPEIDTMATRLDIVNPFLVSTSFMNKFRTLINVFFVAIPFSYFIICGYKFFVEKKEKIVTSSIVFSLIPIVIFTSFVIGSVGRMIEYGTLFSVVLFILMAGRIEPKHWRILKVIAILAVISASYSYVLNENMTITRITYAEESASYFLSTKIDESNVVFTDYRIAAPLLASGHFKVTGIDMISTKKINSELESLNHIYWDNNSESALFALKQIKVDGNHISHIFFSNQMTKQMPGIRTYTFNFKPAPSSFYVKYNINPSFNRIFSNGGCFIYTMN